MAVDFRVGTTGEANATSVQTTIPAPAQVGDVAIATWTSGVSTDVTMTPPTGWTQIGTSTTTTSQQTRVYVKALVAGDIGIAQTWTKSANSKQAVAIAVYSGVDAVTPLGAMATTAGYATSSATRLSPVFAYTGRSIEFAASKGTDPGLWTPPPTFTARATVSQPSTGSVTVAIADSTADLNGGNTWTLGAATAQATVGGLWLSAGIPVPSAQHTWVGAPTSSSFVITSKVSNAALVRAALTDLDGVVTYTGVQAPDVNGRVRIEVTGLRADHLYAYELLGTASGGTEIPISFAGTMRTLQVYGVPVELRKVLIGACINTNTTDVVGILSAATWGADWGHFNGDFTYQGSTSIDVNIQASQWDNQIMNVPGLDTFIADGNAAYYNTSDHEAGGDNGDSNNAYTAANIAAYKQVVPYGNLLDDQTTTTARDQTWDDGRVSFYMTDCRTTDRSPGANPDTATKTMLGAAQKARLINWLQTHPAPFKVILSDVQWMGPTSAAAGKPDAWWSYATERAEIQAVIETQIAAGTHVELWHGDSHLVGYATAVDNTWGGFPVLAAAGYDQTGGGVETDTFTEFWNNSGGPVNIYGRVTLADTGEQITRTFVGWDAAADVQVLSNTLVVDAPSEDDTIVCWPIGTPVPDVGELDCCWAIDPSDCCPEPDEAVSQELIDRMATKASVIMSRLSGYTVGLCRTTIRPLGICRECRTFCCGGADSIHLYGPNELPVQDVLSVTIDGAEVPATEWRFDRQLQVLWRVPPDRWPSRDSRWASCEAEGSFCIQAVVGSEPDAWALDVAANLTCEFVTACIGGKCRLPRNATSVSAQGITVQLSDDEIKTFIPEVSSWVNAVNPYGARLPGRVWSPELDDEHSGGGGLYAASPMSVGGFGLYGGGCCS